MKMGLSSWQDLESEPKGLLRYEEVHTPMFAELGLGIIGPGLNVPAGRTYPFYHSSPDAGKEHWCCRISVIWHSAFT